MIFKKLLPAFLLIFFGNCAAIAANRFMHHLPDSSKPLGMGIGTFHAEKDIPHAKLSSSELGMLREGDLLLRKGYGWISDRIADVLNEEIRITHCGLILTEGFSEPHILHSLSNDRINGVFVEPLKNYLRESQKNSLIGVRLRCDAKKRGEMILESKRLLAKKVPFDLAFNDADSSSLYCAELFGYVFKNVWKRDLLPEKINLFGMNAIRMRNFLNPKEFDVLFNQFEP